MMGNDERTWYMREGDRGCGNGYMPLEAWHIDAYRNENLSQDHFMNIVVESFFPKEHRKLRFHQGCPPVWRYFERYRPSASLNHS